MSNEKKEMTTTIPTRDLIWDILGDHDNGLDAAAITHTTAEVLSFQLKDSLVWKVVTNQPDGEPLDIPQLWRYSDWKASYDNYLRQKDYSHKQRVIRYIEDANTENMAKAIVRNSGMRLEDARRIAYSIVRKNNHEVMRLMGIVKIVTREEEL